jgi:hypothetical protein
MRLKGKKYNSDELRKLPIIIIINSARSAPIFHFQFSKRLFKSRLTSLADDIKIFFQRFLSFLMKTSLARLGCAIKEFLFFRDLTKKFYGFDDAYKKSTKKELKNNCLKFLGSL